MLGEAIRTVDLQGVYITDDSVIDVILSADVKTVVLRDTYLENTDLTPLDGLSIDLTNSTIGDGVQLPEGFAIGTDQIENVSDLGMATDLDYRRIQLVSRSDMELDQLQLFRADIGSLIIDGATIRNLNAGQATFNQFSARSTLIESSVFTGANVRWGSFSGGHLIDVSFTGADLTSSDFAGASMDHVDFSRANLATRVSPTQISRM